MPISFLSIVESGCHTFSFPGWPSKQICLDNEKSTRKAPRQTKKEIACFGATTTQRQYTDVPADI